MDETILQCRISDAIYSGPLGLLASRDPFDEGEEGMTDLRPCCPICQKRDKLSRPDSERVVACVNALAGIRNPAAVRGLIEAVKKERDDAMKIAESSNWASNQNRKLLEKVRAERNELKSFLDAKDGKTKFFIALSRERDEWKAKAEKAEAQIVQSNTAPAPEHNYRCRCGMIFKAEYDWRIHMDQANHGPTALRRNPRPRPEAPPHG